MNEDEPFIDAAGLFFRIAAQAFSIGIAVAFLVAVVV